MPWTCNQDSPGFSTTNQSYTQYPSTLDQGLQAVGLLAGGESQKQAIEGTERTDPKRCFNGFQEVSGILRVEKRADATTGQTLRIQTFWLEAKVFLHLDIWVSAFFRLWAIPFRLGRSTPSAR